MVVGMHLAVETVKQVKALAVGVPRGAKVTQPPLAHGARGIALIMKRLSQGCLLGRQGVLAGKLPLVLSFDGIQPLGVAIVPHVGMPTVLSGQQHAPGRCTDRRPGVKLGHAQTFFGQGVNRGRLDNLLPVAAQFLIAQVIGQENDHIGFAFRCL